MYQLNNAQVAEYKEVFQLFDKDEDGVLSFPELSFVMRCLGQKPSGGNKTEKQRLNISLFQIIGC